MMERYYYSSSWMTLIVLGIASINQRLRAHRTLIVALAVAGDGNAMQWNGDGSATTAAAAVMAPPA